MHRLSIVLLLFSLFLSLPAAAGEEQSGVVKVVATGLGVDQDGAVKNALRAAVEQAVGTIIDSKTVVENDELIGDKILSHSGGYVQKYDILGEPKSEGGLIKVRIEAEVKQMALRSKLAEENIITIASVDFKEEAKQLGAERYTKQLQHRSAVDILPEILAGYPGDYVSVEMDGEPTYDKEKGKFIVKGKTVLKEKEIKSFIRDLAKFLDEASPEPATVVKKEGEQKKNDVELNMSDVRGGKNRIALLTSINKARTSIIYKSYDLTPEMYAIFTDAFAKMPYLSIELYNTDEDILMGKDYKVALPANQYQSSLFIIPLLNFSGAFSAAKPGTTEAVQVYSFDVDPEELAEIDHVKFAVMKK